MGIFWQYFKKTLRWAPIWEDGPLSALVKGASFTLDTARTSILWIRDQFLPEKCDEEYIPMHARSRGIGVKHYRETHTQYRNRVTMAKVWHEKGGKNTGITEILDYYGFEVVILNLRTEDADRWAEFRLYVRPKFWMMAEDYDLLTEITNEYKAASAKLETIVVEFELNQAVYTGITILTATHLMVECN
ncbi:MAG: hypothetical protein GY710_12170 [Desulfobacteraceae bacterium]|nr:hypothetical protein [Desulfobacteraceae bacterium]